LTFYLTGPKAEGFVFVEAQKSLGILQSWEIMELVIDSPQVGRIVLYENGEELTDD